MISDTIKYIGVDDLDIDLFESQYVVPEGMSYNSYLIDDISLTMRRLRCWILPTIARAKRGRRT